jgi:transcriptional regulator with XRE-family HTH domain
MSTQFAHDLRLARRKAGFTQRDVAHLMGARKSTVSDLERGRRRPTLTRIVTLSVIYGRSFESFFGEEVRQAESALRERIITLPVAPAKLVSTFNRDASIEKLAQRLRASEQEYGEA